MISKLLFAHKEILWFTGNNLLIKKAFSSQSFSKPLLEKWDILSKMSSGCDHCDHWSLTRRQITTRCILWYIQDFLLKYIAGICARRILQECSKICSNLGWISGECRYIVGWILGECWVKIAREYWINIARVLQYCKSVAGVLDEYWEKVGWILPKCRENVGWMVGRM